jgi:hypothetical protein
LASSSASRVGSSRRPALDRLRRRRTAVEKSGHLCASTKAQLAPEKLGLRYQSIGAPSAQMACSQSGAAVRLGQRGRVSRKCPEDSYNKRPAERVLTSRTVDNGYRQSSATQRRLRRLPNLLGMAHPSRQHAGRFRPSAVVATTEVETAGDG